MSYLQSQHSPSLWENIPCKLLVSAPFPSHPAPIWFNVCVIVIALRWKGLASHNAKKKKKVPSLQHEHFLQWRGLCPPHLFTTAGAFFVLEGYFVLSAALSAVTVATHFSVSLWWCRHTCRHTRRLQSYSIDRLVQNLFIYQRHKWQQQRKFLNFFPPWKQTVLFLLIHLRPPQRLRPGRYFLLSASDFAGNQDSTLRGRFLVLHVSLLER